VSEQSVERSAVERTAVERGAEGASPRRRGVIGWADPRGRRLGGWAFILNRLTGLGILLYLSFHLVVLSLLARGPSAWDGFVSVAMSPVFLFFDVVLIFGLLAHGLNGIRVTLVGFGLVVDRQKAMFAALMVLGAIALIIAAIRIFEVG
jgi:succinate dehydrogenase / fumarate reductase cytochrome b subunit